MGRPGCCCPHVLMARDNVASTREELAGPVLTIVRAQDERDALRIANETGYGRSSAVFTGTLTAACASRSA